MAIVLLTIVMPLSFLVSCMGKNKDLVEVVFDPQTSYTLERTNVKTFISDSGITKYKLEAATWLIFGKASEPYWFLPDGAYFEQFDTVFNVEASVKADTAYYYERRRIWELHGNVDIITLEGVRIQAPKFFWDQNKQIVYSDTFIKITDEEGNETTGIGFTCKEDMSERTLYKSKGAFLLDMKSKTGDSIPSTSENIDFSPVTIPKDETDSTLYGNE